MELRDYAWPALEILGIGLLWLVKAGAITVALVLYILLELTRIVFVAFMFGRLPRSMMRYL